MISFDIFDTLITRKTYSAHGIFLLLQQKLFHEFNFSQYQVCENFYTLRVNAEKEARLFAEQEDTEEITLDEIYDLLADRSDIPSDLAKTIKEWEIQAEIDNTYPITKNIELLKSFLIEGERVVLISDMYLSEDIIRKILLKNSCIFRDIPIYVSSEIKKTKHSGSLFFEISKREQKDFSNWVHYGDNRISDYLMPNMLGIDARHIPFEEMTPWEGELGRELDLKNNLALQFYFGTARNIRLERNWNISGKIGGSIGGILLYPYVIWILRKSEEMGVKRLYFIARDGYLLKKIADLIIKNKCLNIHTTYLYGSRKAWRINELSETDKQKVIMYISQEVDFSDSDFAFIDLHGTGLTMECLADIILENYSVKTKVFYFDLMKNKFSNSCKFISFCSEHSGIVELFCRAPHGATIGYEQKDGRVVPILYPINEIYWEKPGLYEYCEGVELFADKMSQCRWEYGLENVDLVESVIDYCNNKPCRELQDFMSAIPHYNGVEEDKIEYAPVLSANDIFKIYMWRTIEDISEYYSGINFNLSLMRTNHKYDKEKTFLEKQYNSILGRCIHIVKNRRKRLKGKNNQKVIIYGAGSIGKKVYEHLITISGFHIVGWTDMDYKKYQHKGYPVIPLLRAIKLEFDYIVIAIGNSQSRRYTYEILQDLGVEKKKIVEYKKIVDIFWQ